MADWSVTGKDLGSFVAARVGSRRSFILHVTSVANVMGFQLALRVTVWPVTVLYSTVYECEMIIHYEMLGSRLLFRLPVAGAEIVVEVFGETVSVKA